MVSLVIAGTLGLGVLVAYGIAAGEPELHDPVAVLVNNGGTGIDVAMTSCRSFDVTDVQLIAVANANALNPGPEQLVWDFRPTNPKQRVFHLAQGGPAGPHLHPCQPSCGRLPLCRRVLRSVKCAEGLHRQNPVEQEPTSRRRTPIGKDTTVR